MSTTKNEKYINERMKKCFYVVYTYSHVCSILFACVKNVLLPILSSCCGLIALCNKINGALFPFVCFTQSYIHMNRDHVITESLKMDRYSVNYRSRYR